MGGAGGKESGLPTGAGSLDRRVSGRERGGGVCGGWKKLGRGPHGAYDAKCAAIARALAVTAERLKRRKLGRVRIFTDAQAAITRMTHDEHRPGQTYALQARKALREREPSVEIEIRWFPAHKGIPGNEIVGAWPSRLPASRMTTGSSS